MPTPIPTPTAEQIVTVAEIMRVSTDRAISLISADSDQSISDAKWAATLSDIGLWNGGIATDGGDIKRVDQIEFFEGSASKSRLDLINRVRRRYGLDELTTETGSGDVGMGIVSSLEWFDRC